MDLPTYQSQDMNNLESPFEQRVPLSGALADAMAWAASQAGSQPTPWSGGPWGAFDGFETPAPPAHAVEQLQSTPAEHLQQQHYNFLGQVS